MIIASLKSKEQNKLSSEFFSTVIMDLEVLKLLNIELIRILGPSGASVINYQQGRKVGVALVEKIKEKITIKEFSKLIPKIAKIGMLSGLATKILKINQSGDKSIIKILSTISDKKLKMDTPTCAYISGELVGIADTLTGRPWKCNEVKCISMGHEYDEFVLEPLK